MEDKKTTEESSVLDLNSISFRGVSLKDWEDSLTIKMPSMPTTSYEMQKVVASLNNNYQISYNCYNELMVLHKELEIRVYRQQIKAVGRLIADYKSKGVRAPAKDVVESLVLEKDEDLAALKEESLMYSIIKDFFENNKTKLALSLKSASDLLYSCGQSDKMFGRSERTNGL